MTWETQQALFRAPISTKDDFNTMCYVYQIIHSTRHVALVVSRLPEQNEWIHYHKTATSDDTKVATCIISINSLYMCN